jgi:hypothetical protein
MAYSFLGDAGGKTLIQLVFFVFNKVGGRAVGEVKV